MGEVVDAAVDAADDGPAARAAPLADTPSVQDGSAVRDVDRDRADRTPPWRLPDHPPAPDPVLAARLTRRARVLRVVAGTCLVGATAAPWISEDGPPLVLGPYVPRVWHLTVLLAVVGSCAALAASTACFEAEQHGARPGSRRWYVRLPVGLAKVVVLLAAWLAVGVSAVIGSLRAVTVLAPSSASGCRVVLVEGWADGSVQLLPAGEVRPRIVQAYGWDDGSGPAAQGAVHLWWVGERAVLTLDTSGVDMLSPWTISATC